MGNMQLNPNKVTRPFSYDDKLIFLIVWVIGIFMPWIVKPAVEDIRAWRKKHKEDRGGWRMEYRVMPPKYHDRLTRWGITDGDDFSNKYFWNFSPSF